MGIVQGRQEAPTDLNDGFRKGRVNVKSKYLTTSFLLLTTAAVAYIGMGPVQTHVEAADQPLITVMSPAIASEMVDREPLGPRLDTLEGKTIYMVDISWGGPDAAYSVFEEISAWFAQNIPSVKTVIKRKAGMYSQDDPPLWKEIAANGNAAIIGISG
jgi:hypothetical protein